MRPYLSVLTMIVAVATVTGGASTAQAQGKAAAAQGNPAQFFSPENYPPEAIRLRQEGRVVAKLWLDDTGKVASCTIITSSGSTALDQATCRIALEKMVYTPAKDRSGRAIASQVTLPVRWILPQGPIDVALAPFPTSFEFDMTFSVDSNGVVQACTGTATPTPPDGHSPCDLHPVGSKTEYHWLRDGRPVGGTIRRHMNEEMTIDP